MPIITTRIGLLCRHRCPTCGWEFVSANRTVRHACERIEGLCEYVSDRMQDEDGKPSFEDVPCASCGALGGTSPRAVFWCSKLSEECLPTYRPTDEQYSQYALGSSRPSVCDRCEFFAINAGG